jgi:YebC/PmpR family DNA-binding regulatory protein
MGRWGSIKYKKTASDAKRGVQLAKASHDVMAAARQGGGDVNFNVRLRTAIERAKGVGLTLSKIEHAIERALGAAGADDVESLTYEGYGPGGVAILIEANTNNRNRTAGDIRSYFNKFQGNLGQDGCVAYLFEPVGLMTVALQAGFGLDELLELAIDVGASDVKLAEADPEQTAVMAEVLCPPDELAAVSRALETALKEKKLSLASAELSRLIGTQTVIEDEAIAKPLIRLLDALEDHEDVQQVYANANINAELLERLS